MRAALGTDLEPVGQVAAAMKPIEQDGPEPARSPVGSGLQTASDASQFVDPFAPVERRRIG